MNNRKKPNIYTALLWVDTQMYSVMCGRYQRWRSMENKPNNIAFLKKKIGFLASKGEQYICMSICLCCLINIIYQYILTLTQCQDKLKSSVGGFFVGSSQQDASSIKEGRLKDTHERRPKLSTLNSASSVKKWIPSIKKEIEYYLQQSQLSHYPERKIEEFQLRIETLEKEYKSFIKKIRALDPSCKHKPWSPRPYCKTRVETQDSSNNVKAPRVCESHDGRSPFIGGECNSTASWTESSKILVSTTPTSETLDAGCANQDQPLSFDRTRLAVAAAAFRGLSDQRGVSPTQNLARVLQSSLPNLNNSPQGQMFSTQIQDTGRPEGHNSGAAMQFLLVQDIDNQGHQPDYEAAQRVLASTGEKTGHVLGLNIYSSSDEETNI